MFNLKLFFLLITFSGYTGTSLNREHLFRKLFHKPNDFHQQKIPMPKLTGMKFREARKVLAGLNLNIGAIVHPLEKDSENLDTLIISKQNPTAGNKNGGRNYIEKGKIVDLWLGRPNPVIDRFRKRRIKTVL
jgi:PASTA domain